MSFTLIIVILTSVISFMGFSNQKIIDDLIFYPPYIHQKNQWYRFFSCGVIHADTTHLIFNMLSLYLFGQNVEAYFSQIFGETGKLLYLLLYITSLATCLVPTYMKHKDDYYYRSLGASGGVSAVVFAGLFLDPLARVGILFLPILIPGFVFGPIYLFISAYMAKRGAGGINHSAHFWGAVYGIAFVIVMGFALTPYNLINNFLQQVQSFFS